MGKEQNATTPATPTSAPRAPRHILGAALCRGLVPAWVLTGAIFKLNAADPKLLPRNIWENAFDVGFDLYWLLAILIAIELALAGIMILIPKLSRPTAIFTLAVFVLVLLGELAAGNEKCGCLGSFSPSPYLMLGIDGALLLGCIFFGPRVRPDAPLLPSGPVTVLVLWILAGIGVSFVNILPESVAPAEEPKDAPPPMVQDETPEQDPAEDTELQTPEQPKQAQPKTTAPRRPATYVSYPDQWEGKRFDQLDFVQWVNGWPNDLNQGQKYVILYSPSCDHCQELFQTFFYDPPVGTTIVAIPETRRDFDEDAALPMDCRGCAELELPTGTLYMISPPLVIALNDGVVQCATEAEDIFEPRCLIWHEQFAP